MVLVSPTVRAHIVWRRHTKGRGCAHGSVGPHQARGVGHTFGVRSDRLARGRGVRAADDAPRRMRAARALSCAHPAMAALWRLSAAALADDEDPADYAEQLVAATAAAADATRWVITKRNTVVLTHSSSGSVVRALERVRGKVALVLCTASIPGGEGRALARRLQNAGFEAEVVPDAGIARACEQAGIALVGADAVTEEGVINKVGTALVALAAREAGIGCYAVAATGKFVPTEFWRPDAAPAYESTPLELFDAVVTEKGPKRPGAGQACGCARRAARCVAGDLDLKTVEILSIGDELLRGIVQESNPYWLAKRIAARGAVYAECRCCQMSPSL